MILHLNNKQEEATKRRLSIEYQIQDLELILESILYNELKTSKNLYKNAVKDYTIRTAIKKYKKNNILMLEYNYYYYTLLKRYNKILNNAKKEQKANKKAIYQYDFNIINDDPIFNLVKPAKKKNKMLWYFIALINK